MLQLESRSTQLGGDRDKNTYIFQVSESHENRGALALRGW